MNTLKGNSTGSDKLKTKLEKSLKDYETIAHLEYHIHKLDDKFYKTPTQEEIDGGFRITGPFVALMEGKWNQWNFQEHPEVVGRDAHTFLEQEDGEPAYITLGHTKNPKDRIGYLIESENNKNRVVQRAKITHPEGVTLYDAKLLGKRVSIEADTKIDKRRSTPDNLIVTAYQGRGTAIVKRPACVSCSSAELERLELELNEYNHKDGEKLKDKDKKEENEPTQNLDFIESEGFLDKLGKLLTEKFGIEEKKEEEEKPPELKTPNPEQTPSASLEKDEKGDEGTNMELSEDVKAYIDTKLEEKDTKIAELEAQNSKFTDYFNKMQTLKASETRAKLEEDVKTTAKKLKIELEEDHFMTKDEDGKDIPRDNASLEGELNGYKLALEKFPEGPLPIVLGDTTPSKDDTTSLKDEVAELEKELGSNTERLELIQ